MHIRAKAAKSVAHLAQEVTAAAKASKPNHSRNPGPGVVLGVAAIGGKPGVSTAIP